MDRYEIIIGKPPPPLKKKRKKPVKIPEKYYVEFLTTTHRLKKTFKSVQGDDIFRKGSPIYVPIGNQGSNQCVVPHS